MCTVFIDSIPAKSCLIKIGSIDGKKIETLESLGDVDNLHPLQLSFLETGAIQCGFCTPAQILTAKALLDKNPNPTEAEVRESLSVVMCRCTGYVRIIDAVLRAAAKMRGEILPEYAVPHMALPKSLEDFIIPPDYQRSDGNTKPLMPLVLTPEGMTDLNTVGKNPIKVDGVKLVTGKPAFTDEIHPDGMLFAALFTKV